MLVYRICRRPFRALDGEGARLWGGRWNAPGTPIVYAAASLSLAAVEYLVHLDTDVAPADLVAMAIEVPDDAERLRVSADSLPADWARVPEHPGCQAVGDAWLREGVSLTLRVPSAVIPEEENVLINPAHRDAARLRVRSERPFVLDPRLVRT